MTMIVISEMNIFATEQCILPHDNPPKLSKNPQFYDLDLKISLPTQHQLTKQKW